MYTQTVEDSPAIANKTRSRNSNTLERIYLMAKIEFKLRYYENKLGLFWALLKPLSEIAIFYIAFQVILKQNIPNFISFLFLGLILWFFFLESTTGTIQILKTKKYLYEYTNMNKMEIYISTILSNFIGLSFNFAMFLTFFLLFEKDVHISHHAVYFIPILINLLIIALGSSLILSNLFVWANDINQIWMLVSTLMFYISPILYNPIMFREALPGMEYVNPVAGIILNARDVLIYNQYPDWNLFWFDWVYGIVILLTGLFLLKKLGKNAAEKL